MINAALPLLGILDTLSDMAFVIKILTFAYLLYWLFIVFREQQMLLGIATIIAGYFMFFHQISIVLLVLFFFVFIIMSGHFQFLIDMGIMPILGFMGFQETTGAHGGGGIDQIRMQKIQEKVQKGGDLSNEEIDFLQRTQDKDMQYQQRWSNLTAQHQPQQPH